MSNQSFHTARGNNNNGNNTNNNDDELSDENIADLQPYADPTNAHLRYIQHIAEERARVDKIVNKMDADLDTLYTEITILAERRKQNKSKPLRDEYNRLVDRYNALRDTFIRVSTLYDTLNEQFKLHQQLGGTRRHIKNRTSKKNGRTRTRTRKWTRTRT
jgi:galactokinase